MDAGGALTTKIVKYGCHRGTPVSYVLYHVVQVDISAGEAEQLDDLDCCWQSFLQELGTARVRLDQRKMEFRASLVRTADSFVKATAAARETFLQSAPFSSEVCTRSHCACIISLLVSPPMLVYGAAWGFVLLYTLLAPIPWYVAL